MIVGPRLELQCASTAQEKNPLPTTTTPQSSRGTRHPIEKLWREVGLPEYFLGNDGTNTKLYELYDRIRGAAQGRQEPEFTLQTPMTDFSRLRAEEALQRQTGIKPVIDALARDLVAAGESEYAQGSPERDLPTLDEYRNNLIEECAKIAELYRNDEPETVRMVSYRCEIAARIRTLSLSSTEGK